MSRVPALFVGHGAPTLALDPAKGQALREWGSSLPRPRAVLVISAHWETPHATLGATESRPLVHDYRGFPPALREVRYPAPGAPELAARVEALLGPLPRDPTRGWDHGVWTPLVHLLPEAEVPLLQVSLPRRGGPEALLELGRELAPLRDEGVWILGSGNLTHDLSAMRPDGTPPSEAAQDFDAWAAGRLEAGDFAALAAPGRHREDFRDHHPSTEHWDALLPVLGASDPGRDPVRFPVLGWEYGDLSRRAVQLG